ncbi:uncharacterized protein DUF1499 [Roseibium hamelinense]|uniref:Uncharacterized protein DUF1499 n=1 Tax=Roseibium hamelinense TaxID=150831 RepID=A0A562SUG4_9HYPH|nr:DUF4190 domain-containing protein [Roseibium hamelinense]MTI42714.1 DUF4190 domain-containing protein [Roseibium hamelinense]TWI84594.1 uncharacterized protein DUF1499 [Roseibium hamelinense]
MKRFPVYQSGSARLSYRIGVLSLPVLVIALLAMRLGIVDPETALLALMSAGLFGIFALLLGMVALGRLWKKGGEGAARAVAGCAFGALVFLPVGLLVSGVVSSPGLGDISTDMEDPPEIRSSGDLATGPNRPAWTQPENSSLLQNVRLLAVAVGVEAQKNVMEAYPDIVSRRYRVAPGRLHTAALLVGAQNGWTLSDELPPDLADSATRIQFSTRNLLTGLPSSVTLRIRPDPLGALLDIRAVSSFPVAGLSDTADTIRRVYSELDRILLETYGEFEPVLVEEDLGEGELSGAEPDSDSGILPEFPSIPVPEFKPYLDGADEAADG